jgi:hypothetical protein
MQKQIRSQDPLIYTLSFKRQDANIKEKAFIIFGEHARELISVETGFNFV